MPPHPSRVHWRLNSSLSLSQSGTEEQREMWYPSMSCTLILPLNVFPIRSKTCPILTNLNTKATNTINSSKVPPYHQFKRFRFITNVSSSSSSSHSSSSSNSVEQELPLLPFPTDQILVPTESKTLHLYEARYLALLDQSLFGRKKHFVHFVLDPIGISGTSEASFAAKYGCLVAIEKVERLDIGALVSIRGIGRVKIVNFLKAEPYLQGVVKPMQDLVPDSIDKLNAQITELKEALHCLNGLEMKLKAPKEALLQTRIANSLQWAEKDLSIDSYEPFLPQLAERLSFAALQPVSGLTPSESFKLQQEKLKAMNVKDTNERLTRSLEYVKDNVSMVAAKLAIQSLGP